MRRALTGIGRFLGDPRLSRVGNAGFLAGVISKIVEWLGAVGDPLNVISIVLMAGGLGLMLVPPVTRKLKSGTGAAAAIKAETPHVEGEVTDRPLVERDFDEGNRTGGRLVKPNRSADPPGSDKAGEQAERGEVSRRARQPTAGQSKLVRPRVPDPPALPLINAKGLVVDRSALRSHLQAEVTAGWELTDQGSAGERKGWAQEVRKVLARELGEPHANYFYAADVPQVVPSNTLGRIAYNVATGGSSGQRSLSFLYQRLAKLEKIVAQLAA